MQRTHQHIRAANPAHSLVTVHLHAITAWWATSQTVANQAALRAKPGLGVQVDLHHVLIAYKVRTLSKLLPFRYLLA